MNAESETATPKRKIISLPFLLVAVVLVVGGYPAGKWVMEKIIFKQEQDKFSGAAIAPEEDVTSGGGDMAEQTNSVGGGGGLRGTTARQPGGGGGGQRGGGGGNFDPEALFARRDADANGKLEGEEISERMQDRVEAMDTDKDGAISKEEFLAAMQNRGGGEGGGEGGQRRRRPDSDDSGGDADNGAGKSGDQ